MENKNELFPKLKESFDKMIENNQSGDYWKNIQIARDALHLMKENGTDYERKIYMDFCKAMIDNDILQESETPRLLLEYINYHNSLTTTKQLWKRQAARLIKMTDPNTSEQEIKKLIKAKRFLLFDPVQLSEKYEEVIYDVEKECDEILKDEPRCMGFCYMYWSTKHSVLQKHGIEWRSPSRMNPRVMFD